MNARARGPGSSVRKQRDRAGEEVVGGERVRAHVLPSLSAFDRPERRGRDRRMQRGADVQDGRGAGVATAAGQRLRRTRARPRRRAARRCRTPRPTGTKSTGGRSFAVLAVGPYRSMP